jgi:hypothetical protein
MPFFVDGNPTPSEISEAINYLLGNAQQTTSTDIGTGQVTDATGSIVSYLYKYLHVKYADSFDGTLNFSNTPTGRTYYGIHNTDSNIESTNPADYIWTKATPPAFGSTYFLYYTVTGGRRINIIVSTSAPSTLWQADAGTPIDLDFISGNDGASSRICYAKSTSTSLSSLPATYQTSGNASFPPTNTWGGGETWQATPPSLAVNEALFQSDGIYNPVSDLTTWNVPYLSNLRVGALSAISANLGTVTAGELIISGPAGTPTISGTTMTGAGAHFYNDGRFALGNAAGNIVFDGSNVNLNGFLSALTGYTATVIVPLGGADVTLFTFTLTEAGTVMVNLNTLMTLSASTSSVACICSVGIRVKNSSGTVVSSNTAVGFASATILPTVGGFSKIAAQSNAYNQVLSLAAGTYSVVAGNSAQTVSLDAAGNTVTTNSIIMQDIVASAYQVLV